MLKPKNKSKKGTVLLPAKLKLSNKDKVAKYKNKIKSIKDLNNILACDWNSLYYKPKTLVHAFNYRAHGGRLFCNILSICKVDNKMVVRLLPWKRGDVNMVEKYKLKTTMLTK